MIEKGQYFEKQEDFANSNLSSHVNLVIKQGLLQEDFIYCMEFCNNLQTLVLDISKGFPHPKKLNRLIDILGCLKDFWSLHLKLNILHFDVNDITGLCTSLQKYSNISMLELSLFSYRTDDKMFIHLGYSLSQCKNLRFLTLLFNNILIEDIISQQGAISFAQSLSKNNNLLQCRISLDYIEIFNDKLRLLKFVMNIKKMKRLVIFQM
ncbi:hypothetical protein TTHERM_00736540 (macronuclear) [Tetrahymena thermophila SB210]|uniref:Kinase domain protein n=1 Tax=Tetrahymena thermophila (strain SB210) TaxID=312017 RepID=Q231U1_TETTS|nr:hypothetical protein TTHERM_00736540 [Tetrahymena thermophila SB210]EAR91359.2 hypothetical protein TTHERM_00736540 [Tetrahymena thermophila SB210]|eukprot:XP_001011604.2 hypothetical protein TTHERM_00736540 [Tetrahymena thermophila SB210]